MATLFKDRLQKTKIELNIHCVGSVIDFRASLGRNRNQISDLWQQLGVASELESCLRDTVGLLILMTGKVNFFHFIVEILLLILI